MEDEQDSQATYEDFTAQTSATIKAKQSEVDGKMKEILLEICGPIHTFRNLAWNSKRYMLNDGFVHWTCMFLVPC